jgi:Lysyl oxidase
VALFEIRFADDDGGGGDWGAVFAGQSIKTTFCLIDVIKLEGNSNTGDRTYWDCFPDAHQGISAGWGDQYHQATEGQELEVTGARPGVYYLVSTSNPDGNFLETTTANNTAWTIFRLTRDSKGNAKVTEISHSACSGTLCGEDIPNR